MATSDVTIAQDGGGNVKLHPYLVTLVRWCVSCLWSTATVLLHRLMSAPLQPITGPKPQFARTKIPKRAPGTEHLHPEPKVDCQILHQPTTHTHDVIFVHGLYGSLGNTWRQGDWRLKYKNDPKKVVLRNESTKKECSCNSNEYNDNHNNTRDNNEQNDNHNNTSVDDNIIYNIAFKNMNYNEDLITEKFYNNTLINQVEIIDNYETQASFVRDLFKNECSDCEKSSAFEEYYKDNNFNTNSNRFFDDKNNTNNRNYYNTNEGNFFCNSDKCDFNNGFESDSGMKNSDYLNSDTIKKCDNKNKCNYNSENLKNSAEKHLYLNNSDKEIDDRIKNNYYNDNKTNSYNENNSDKEIDDRIKNNYYNDNNTNSYNENNTYNENNDRIKNNNYNDNNTNSYNENNTYNENRDIENKDRIKNNNYNDNNTNSFNENNSYNENSDIENKYRIKNNYYNDNNTNSYNENNTYNNNNTNENSCVCNKQCEVGCGCNCDVCYSTCWPRDWIKQDYPGARVISINYTSDPYLWRPLWVNENKRLSLHERAEQMMTQLLSMGVGDKPIIWVGHSKGGLFIKQIYCEAYEAYKQLHNISNEKEQKMNEHSSKMNEHSSKTNEHSSKLNEHSSTMNEHSSKMNEHSSKMNEHSPKMNEHIDFDSKCNLSMEDECKIKHESEDGKHSASSNEAYLKARSSLWEQSKGFMFYSVPHRGSPLADIKTPVTARSVELLEISKDCPLVLELQARWLSATATTRPPVHSFVETCRTLMSVLWLTIVSVDSADAGIGTLVGLSVDHREICKPSSRKCILYTELTDLMRKALSECKC